MKECQINQSCGQEEVYLLPATAFLLAEADETEGAPSSSSRLSKKHHGKNVDVALDRLAVFGEAGSEMSRIQSETKFQQLAVVDMSSYDWHFKKIEIRASQRKEKSHQRLESSEKRHYAPIPPKYNFISRHGAVCSESDLLIGTAVSKDPTGILSLIVLNENPTIISCAQKYITHRCKANHPDPKMALTVLNEPEFCEKFPEPSKLVKIIEVLTEATQGAGGGL